MRDTKLNRFQDFVSFSQNFSIRESVEGKAKEIEREIDPQEVEEIEPEKLAATLSHLIDAGGDLSKIDIDEIEENFEQTLEESENDNINESENGLVYVLEIVGTTLGNVDIVHFINDMLSKKLGKQVDISKHVKHIKNIVDHIKDATGYPAKIFKKFFEWIGKIMGLDKVGSKLMGLASLAVLTIILIIVGIVFFPAAAAISGISGVLALILSITALIGKVAEIVVISQEIIKVIILELHNAMKNKKEPTEVAILS